jgi:hypothetical protein|eukprot:COSAG01_NODE_6506_length_3628_cov_17.003117_6_plen_163_part_00
MSYNAPGADDTYQAARWGGAVVTQSRSPRLKVASRVYTRLPGIRTARTPHTPADRAATAAALAKNVAAAAAAAATRGVQADPNRWAPEGGDPAEVLDFSRWVSKDEVENAQWRLAQERLWREAQDRQRRRTIEVRAAAHRRRQHNPSLSRGGWALACLLQGA